MFISKQIIVMLVFDNTIIDFTNRKQLICAVYAIMAHLLLFDVLPTD